MTKKEFKSLEKQLVGSIQRTGKDKGWTWELCKIKIKEVE